MTRKRQRCVFPPLAAHTPASRILRISSSGTGSGFNRRMARVVWMISNRSLGMGFSFPLEAHHRAQRTAGQTALTRAAAAAMIYNARRADEGRARHGARHAATGPHAAHHDPDPGVRRAGHRVAGGRQDLRGGASLRGPGGGRRRGVLDPDHARSRDQHPPRPRALHRQGRRHPAHDGRALRPRGRLLQGQGRVHAHRRLRGGHAGRQRHRRRRAAHRLRGGPGRPARGPGRRDRLLLRRRRGRRGRVPRGAQHRLRCGSCPSSSSARTTSTRPTTRWPSSIRGCEIAAHAERLRHARASPPTATTCSRSTRAPARPWPAPAAGEGPSLLECQTYRWHFHAMRAAIPPETRPAEEVASWKARDPIARFEQHVLARACSRPPRSARCASA